MEKQISGVPNVKRPSKLHADSDPMGAIATSTGFFQTSFTTEEACSLDLKAQNRLQAPQPKGPPNLSSPIDLLPPGQPIPEAFKLALEQDMRKGKQEKGYDYENVPQVAKKMQECTINDTEANFPSDPKKMAEIERYERNFHSPLEKGLFGSGNQGVPPLQHENSCEKNDDVMYASDPKKVAQLEGDAGKLNVLAQCRPDYVNISGKLKEGQEVSFDDTDKDEYEAAEPTVNPFGKEFVDSFDREFEEIQTKAKKGCSAMMGIFNQVENERNSLDYVDSTDYIDDDDEFNIHFDFDDSSGSSTITGSVNNDVDILNSADITEEDLFGEAKTSPEYVNVTEKISNKTMEAKLEEHHKKLNHYQQKFGNDVCDLNNGDIGEDTDDDDCEIDEMQERSVHVSKGFDDNKSSQSRQANVGKTQNLVSETSAIIDKSLPTTLSEKKEQNNNFDETIKSHSLPDHLMKSKINGQGHIYVNQKSLKIPREACEGECLEYV